MARLTQADWKLILHYLRPFRHFKGLAALLDKVEENIVEGDSEYIKFIRFEFLPNGASDPLAPSPHAADMVSDDAANGVANGPTHRIAGADPLSEAAGTAGRAGSGSGAPHPLAPGAPAEPAQPSDSECVRRLVGLGCRVLAQTPPLYVLQVPHDGDEFDQTIDLLESLHRNGRIRYLR